MVASQVLEMNRDIDKEPVTSLSTAELDTLPLPVRNYLEFTGFKNARNFRNVRLKQEGMFRSALQSEWMPFSADQYFNIPYHSFLWYAVMKGPMGIKFHAMDKYIHGTGNMQVKLANLFNIANVTGPEIDQGELTRFLAEMMWFPSAFKQPYIFWEPVNELSARVTIKSGEKTAGGTFEFEKDGRLINFNARRYKSGGKYFFLEDWCASVQNYKKFGEFLLPSEFEVTWKLNIGELTYIRAIVNSIEFDNPGIY